MFHVALLIVLGVSWGAGFAVIKYLIGFPLPEVLSLAVATFTATIILFLSFYSKLNMSNMLRRRTIKFAIICGLTSFLLPLLLEFHVLETLDIMLAAVVISTAPVFSMIFFLLQNPSRLKLNTVLGIILGFMSCAVALLSQGSIYSDGLNLVTLFILVMIPLSYGFYNFYVEIKWPKDLTVKELAVSELIVCSIACLILLPFEKIEVENVNIEWASLCLLLGVMVSIEAVLFFEIQSKRGALFCSVADYIATISGVLFGVILFSETANILMLLSILMVLVSTMIVNQSEPKKHAS